MTDNEIVKALECCAGVAIQCKSCSFREYNRCQREVIKATLDLINHQKAEFERLTETLNATIAGQETLQRYLSKVQADTVKEFAERLKERFAEKLGNTKESFACFSICREIDNLVKEMVGDGG